MTAADGVPFEQNPPPDTMPDLELDVDALPLTTRDDPEHNSGPEKKEAAP